MKALLKFLLVAFTVPTAIAQGVNITDESGSPGASVPVTLEYTAQNNLRQFQVEITYDDSVLTPQTTTDPIFGEEVDGCLASPGANWDGSLSNCNSPSPGTILLTVSTGAPNSSPALDTAVPFGTMTFDIDGAAPLATAFPIAVSVNTAIRSGTSDNVPSDLTTNDGSITTDIPAGQTVYSSNPSIGSTINFGNTLVGATTGAQTITVSNLQDDGTAFDILGSTGGTSAGATINVTAPGMFPASVAGDGGTSTVDVSFTCTPTARGEQSGTLTVANDADLPTDPESYPLTCTGLSPNIQIPAGPVSLSSTVAGGDPSANITVTNPQDNFTSTANNVTATAGAGEAEITVTTGGPANIAPNNSFDFEVSCDSSAEGNFSRTIDFSWDDPAGPGTGSIEVECSVSDTAPIYNSDPAPGTALALTAAAGSQSAPDGLDINNANTNQAGDDLTISSATASEPVFTVNIINSSFGPNVAADGSDDIEVTCTPPGVGTINGMLTVQTNDPNEPAGGFTYPLSCEGTGEVLTTDPDDGGTLNLGTVPPGTQTPEGTISFTNNSLNDSVQVGCGVTDTAGVFSFTPNPIEFTLDAGQTEEVVFQGTPTDISTFTADVECNNGILRGLNGPFFTVTVSGRPLVIPTMSRWGLVVMSLMLLLVGGFATRRMMA